jgi:hypothetical protein
MDRHSKALTKKDNIRCIPYSITCQHKKIIVITKLKLMQEQNKVNKINVNWIQRISGMKNKVDVKAIKENQGGIEDAHRTITAWPTKIWRVITRPIRRAICLNQNIAESRKRIQCLYLDWLSRFAFQQVDICSAWTPHHLHYKRKYEELKEDTSLVNKCTRAWSSTH